MSVTYILGNNKTWLVLNEFTSFPKRINSFQTNIEMKYSFLVFNLLHKKYSFKVGPLSLQGIKRMNLFPVFCNVAKQNIDGMKYFNLNIRIKIFDTTYYATSMKENV